MKFLLTLVTFFLTTSISYACTQSPPLSELIHELFFAAFVLLLPIVILLAIVLPTTYFFKKRKLLKQNDLTDAELRLGKSKKRRVFLFTITLLLCFTAFGVEAIWSKLLEHDEAIKEGFFIENDRIYLGKEGSYFHKNHLVEAGRYLDKENKENVIINADTFQELACDYYKDKNYVYVEYRNYNYTSLSTCPEPSDISHLSHLILLPEIEPNTFEATEGWCDDETKRAIMNNPSINPFSKATN